MGHMVEPTAQVLEYLARIGGPETPEQVRCRFGTHRATNAVNEIAPGEGPFDLAFIDADKPGYDGYYEAALKLLRPGGVIALDNMLYSGQVADPKAKGNAAPLR